MGISSSKSKTTPVYAPQITGAGSTLTGVYNQNAPNIQRNADALSGLLPGLIQRFNEGDPGVNAAQTYNTDVLSGRYLDEGNPYLNDIITNSNDDIRNQIQAALGAKGLTGGSSYADVISKNIARNTTDLRYNDYNAERGRMGAAAGQAPGLAAAQYIPLEAAFNAASAANDPLRAAVGYTSGLGSLLGNYTETKSKNAWGPALAAAMASAAAAYAGGG